MTDTTGQPDVLAELAAMKAIHAALDPLSPEGRSRVVSWAVGALGVAASVSTGGRTTRNTDRATDGDADDGDAERAANPDATYTAFADLLGDAQPRTEADKALVGGYWFQVVTGAEDFGSQAVNDKLKDTGEAVLNITRAFDRLKAAKPQLVRQLVKSGKSQQARKKFKLTTAGIQAVERMLREQA